MRGRAVRLGTVTLADAAALLTLRPHLRLLSDLRAPHAWVARVGIDGAVAEFAAAALWLAACWLAVGLLAAAIGAAPGSCGRVGARIAATLLPRAVYRVVAGAAGLGIALTPVAAGAIAQPHAPSATVSPAWPTSTAPTPLWPSLPHVRAAAPDPHTHPRPRSAQASPASARQVVVAPGDSLWSIAASHLDHPSAARVAAAWPRWYAANRAVIGTDPNSIIAGQVLDVPVQHREKGTS
jgi:hypothetical protein